jgi:putative spermidine/putrescine transport system substrate-binding protein
MSRKIARRSIMKGIAAGGVAAATTSPLTLTRSALAKDNLVAVEWGPPYIDATKKQAAKYKDANIKWELHQGGAAAILAKIKTSWPNTSYDIVDCWSPVFKAMVKEGWAMPVTAKDIPNLKDIPDSLFTKDDKGNLMNVPRNLNYVVFAARADKVPFKIQKLSDLYDPRLKRQILWPSPIMNTCAQIINLALANGGDERNMEPGWKALKDLAMTGNIGRIYHTTSDNINSMSSGETSVTFADLGTLSGIAKNFKVDYLTKSDPSLKSFLAVEGWVVLANTKNKKAACDFLNYLISPENATDFNKTMQTPPASSKAKAPAGMEYVVFNEAELKKFVYQPDYDYIATQTDSWVKRFESEIVPLIK